MKTLEVKIKSIEDRLTRKNEKVLYLNRWQDVIAYGHLVSNGTHLQYTVYVKNEMEDIMYVAFLPE